MKKILICLIAFTVLSCSDRKTSIIKKYENVKPTQWSEDVIGVVKTLPTTENVLALTLDLCGSKNDSLDEELVQFLIDNKIPATFFVNNRWIRKYPEKFKKLANNNLFEIENHGNKHIPASVNGNSIYNIKGSNSAEELYDEIEDNAKYIEKLTGRKPKFFRSGTAYYDEYAVNLIYDMGIKPIGFNILGDAGATYSAKQVKKALLKAKSGDIIICHANHPEKQTGKGLKSVLPLLKAKGFIFIKLEEYIK